MVSALGLALFYVLFPALIIYLCNRSSFFEKIGAAVLCYAAGILASTLGLMPVNAAPIQNITLSIAVPLSIPLMLYATNVRSWLKLAGATMIATIGMFISVVLMVGIAYILLRHHIADAWKLAGMAVGVYTGGSANLNAIGLALQASQHLLVLANTAEMLACTPLIFFILTYAKKVLSYWLPPFVPERENMENSSAKSEHLSPKYSSDHPDVCEESSQNQRSRSEGSGGECMLSSRELQDFSGMLDKAVFLPLLRGIGVALLIFAVGAAFYSIAPKTYNMAVLILVITTLSIAASLIPAIQRTPKAFQVGYYIILVFCLVVGSMADIRQLIDAAPVVFGFMALVLYGSLFIHIIICRIFRIDVDTAIVVAVAAVFSPPFVPVVAAVLQNRTVIISGITAGIIGWAIGNYLGISIGYILYSLSTT
jgi:uncharacterized membrane protein